MIMKHLLIEFSHNGKLSDYGYVGFGHSDTVVDSTQRNSVEKSRIGCCEHPPKTMFNAFLITSNTSLELGLIT